MRAEESSRGQIESRLRALVERVLAEARLAAKGVVPKLYKNHLTEEAGGQTFGVTTVPEAGFSVWEEVVRNQLYLGPLGDEADSLLGAFTGHAVRGNPPKQEGTYLGTSRPLVLHVARSVCANEDWIIDEAKWQQVFQTVWRILAGGTIRTTLLAPVAGIVLDRTLSLGDIILRPLSLEERATIGDPGRDALEGDPKDCRAAIELTRFGPPDAVDNREADVALILDALTALRVWHGGWIAMPFILSAAEFDAGHARHPVGRLRLATAVHLDDPDGFVRFWFRARLGLGAPPPGIDVALRRIRLMHDSPRGEDRLLDQMIALEALFLTGSEKQELKYRLALRAAHFVGTGHSGRRRYFDVLRQAYDERSKIVHGDAGGTDLRIHQEVDTLLRLALIWS